MNVLVTLSLVALVGLALARDGADDGAAGPRVALETSKGTIVLELDPARAPKTVENFLGYVESGFYDGTIFHRVIPNFMVQGGGFTPEMRQKPTRAPVENEAPDALANQRGTIAMARTNDPHSATAQFFINVADNAFLDHKGGGQWGYAAFGRVVEGMDAVDAIAGVTTTRKGHFDDVPAEPVTIESARVVAAGGE